MSNWFTREARGPLEHALLILITLAIMFLVAVVAARELPYLRPIDPSRFGFRYGDTNYTFVAAAYFVIVLFEEICFCALPISIAYALNRRWLTLLLLVAVAIAFGFYPMHKALSLEAKWVLVLCRGLLLFLFVKMSGWSPHIKWKPLCAVVIAHYVTGVLTFALMSFKHMLFG